jgi:hypothetical protein
MVDWTDTKQWKNNGAKQPRMSEQCEMLDLTDGKYHTVRMVGKTTSVAQHWFSTINKEGAKSKKGINNFPKMCHGLEVGEDGKATINSENCPYCTILEHNPSIEVYINVIDRKMQENEPRKKSKHTRAERERKKLNGMTAYFVEDMDSESWTPVRVARITSTMGRKISELASLNTRKINGVRKAFSPDHSKYGFDILMKFDAKAATASEAYQIQKGELTALTEEEIAYLRWDTSLANLEKLADAKKEAARMKPLLCNRSGELTFPELAHEEKKKGSKGKHDRFKDNFDEDEDEDEDEDDDEDEKPRKKKLSKSKIKSKSRRDEEDEDDDEDEKPKSKSSSKRKVVDEDEDEDDDEDEKPRKKKPVSKKIVSSKSKKPSRDEDEDDEDPWDDDDEDDEDD